MAISSLVAFLSYAIALCGVGPLFPWLPMVPRMIIMAGMAAGIWQAWRGAWRLKNWLLNASVMPAVLFYAVQVTRANPLPPVVSVLAIMLAVRLLGEKSSRHYLQIYALSLFCLAASSLFDLSPIFLLYLALMLFMVAMALVLLCFHDHDRRLVLSGGNLRRVLTAGLLMPLASMPLIIFFFPLLPRTQVLLWNFQAASPSRLSGFSDKVEPGGSSAVEQSRRLVFRAELPRQPGEQLYWRGAVFNRLDGNRWLRDPAVPQEQIRYSSSRLHQEIYPEPGLSMFLPALDAPANLASSRARRAPDGTFATSAASGRRQHYGADSVAGGVLPVTGTIDRDFYLRLPNGYAARIRELADSIAEQAATDALRLTLLERHFQKGDYRYTMRGLPTGGQALEQFLFDSKQGNCEFFASAFAIVARAAGLPTRLVVGYLGGEYNDLGGYYLVREQMAHVWVEVFVEGKGWVRSDPSSLAQNAGEVWSADQRPGLLRRLRLLIDSFDHAWNRSVITYDFERQVEAAISVGKRFQALTVKRALEVLIAPALSLTAVAAIAFALMKRRHLLPSPEERLLHAFYRRVERDCGVKVDRGRQGLFELAQMTGSQQAREFVAIYAAAIYRDRRLTEVDRARLWSILAAGFGGAKANHSR